MGDRDVLEHLKHTATPLRLAEYLTPKIWGEDAPFRVDPWLTLSEERIMDAFLDPARRFLKINAPPQVTKTTLAEIWTPLWILGHWPHTRIGLICYSDDLAQDSGSLVRDMIKNWGMELFGIEIDPSYDSKKTWRIAGCRGGMHSVGIGSTVTGKPMDVVIIGDVIKNMEEAGSKATKDKHWAEMSGAIRARQAKLYLLAATRFADDDISGRIDARQDNPDYKGERWESLAFKAIAEPSLHEEDGPEWRDLLGRQKGEPLLCRFSAPDEEKPENWETSHFYITRASEEDQFVWSAVYQQEPTSPTGGMFPPINWAWYDPDDIPSLVAKRRAWDLAATEGAGDWSVGVLAGRTWQGDILVLDVLRDRKSGHNAKTWVEQTAMADGPVTRILIERERAGAGKALFEFYQRALPLYDVQPAVPDGSKEERARPASILQQSGRLKLPKRADGTSPAWVPGYIEELRKIMGDGRRPRHDDQIDTTAYAVNDMINVATTYMAQNDHRFSGSHGLVSVGDPS